ncbi:MAG: RHS repeat domain-containing protein [Cyclobacteriaceae bacterium]
MRVPIKSISLRKTVALVLICSAWQFVLLAQDDQRYPDVNIISPTASSLGKYVDFPINLHTGVPQINIPIYTVQEGPLSLPISMSYHASGLKVQERASWVGAGWTLNAGGVISRNVRGLPDEKVGNTNTSVYEHGSVYRDGGYSPYFLTTINQSGEEQNDFQSFKTGRKDGEPDIFFFNFVGQGGKFYINPQQEVVQIPESDLSIDVVTKPGDLTPSVIDYIQGFTVTTPDGTKYFFGITGNNSSAINPVERSQSKTVNNLYAENSTVYSSWYLHKIESADGEFDIDIDYVEESYAYYTNVTSPCLPNCTYSMEPIKILIEGVRLSSINFSNGSVQFNANNLRQDLLGYNLDEQPQPNTQSKSLSEIQLQGNAFCKKFTLSTSYFTDASPIIGRTYNIMGSPVNMSDNKRLRLNSLKELDCNSNTTKPAHVFDYYEPESVPRSMSLAVDHWGFYNGAVSNQTLVPPISTNNGETYGIGDGSYGSANRESSWPEMRAGALKSIQYPTSGKTEFIYEPNLVNVKDQDCDLSVGSGIATIKAIRSDLQAGQSELYSLNVPEDAFYYVSASKSGDYGSGRVELNGSTLMSVGAANPHVSQFIFLNSGVHRFQAFRNAISGSNAVGAGAGVCLNISHSISDCTTNDIPTIVGGLRIKSTNQIEGGNNVITKTYEYSNANLYSIPNYIFKIKNEVFNTGVYDGTKSMGIGGCYKKWPDSDVMDSYRSTSSVHPMLSHQGYHIGYGRVKEIQADGGYTVSEFEGRSELPTNWNILEDVSVRKIDESVCQYNDPVYPVAPLPYDFSRGNLRSRQYYTSDNVMLREEKFIEHFQPKSELHFGIKVSSFLNGLALPTVYEIQSGQIQSQKSTEKVFNPSDLREYSEVETETVYESEFHHQPTKVKTTSYLRADEQLLVYPKDLTKCDEDCLEHFDSYLQQAAELKVQYDNNYSLCATGTYTECNSFRGKGDNDNPCIIADCTSLQGCPWLSTCRLFAYQEYHYALNELRIDYINNLRSCTNNCVESGLLNSDPEVKAIFQMEANNQVAMPIEVTSKLNGKTLKSSYFDYDISPADQEDIYLKKVHLAEFETPTTNFESASLLNGSLLLNNSYNPEPEVDILYDDGQIVQRTNRDGVINSYIWGYNNTLPLVHAVGVDYSVLKAVYDVNPQAIRSAFPQALITTYEYDPLIGITKQTDPNGRVSTYEYDDLGRLQVVRDHDNNILQKVDYHYGEEAQND